MLWFLVLAGGLFGTARGQTATEEGIPLVIKPVRNIFDHPNISGHTNKIPFAPLHVLEGYYPDAFFLFIHIPKTGGTTFNVRSCPVSLRSCGESCGCGNCGLPTYNNGETPYPKLSELLAGTCPMLSYEINYDGFRYAYENPVSPKGRTIYMMTMLRNPYDFIRSQIGHFLSRYSSKYKAGDHSEHVTQCMDAKQHFNASSGCNVYKLHNGQTAWLANGDLDLAMSMLKRMFAVGITEYHVESMCLYQYQLGQFNRNRCNYEYIHEMESKASAKVWSTSNEAGAFDKEHGMSDLLVFHISKDLQLWNEAIRIFANRIRYVEKQENIQILHPLDPLWKLVPVV